MDLNLKGKVAVVTGGSLGIGRAVTEALAREGQAGRLAVDLPTDRFFDPAVPHEAAAHMQLRFVVGTRWQDLLPLLRCHLDAHGFGAVEIEPGMACAAQFRPGCSR